ncbi:MAG TPA: cobalamin-dependent protein, partial [Paludibacteraceae bacterium]|nr:cobalamin-dependent protein [Paludibacteraceae bacterium]
MAKHFKQIDTKKEKIILATVQGDIHDIGKNIVKIVLESHGFQIIDLGKNVAIEKVVEAFGTHQPD